MGGGSRLDRGDLLVPVHMERASNMAAAAGEGSALQELHCEHKAKAEGEGRDQAAAPAGLLRPPPPPNRATPTIF